MSLVSRIALPTRETGSPILYPMRHFLPFAPSRTLGQPPAIAISRASGCARCAAIRGMRRDRYRFRLDFATLFSTGSRVLRLYQRAVIGLARGFGYGPTGPAWVHRLQALHGAHFL
jgi:hypothetical protein